MKVAAVVVFIIEVLLSHTPGEASGNQSKWLSSMTGVKEGVLRRAAHIVLFLLLSLFSGLGFGVWGIVGVAVWALLDEDLKELARKIIREKQEQAKVRLEQHADFEVGAIEVRVETLKEERKAAYRDYVDGKISLERNLAVKDRVGKELEGLKEEIVRRNVQKMDHYRMVQALEDLLRVDELSPANFRRIVEAVYWRFVYKYLLLRFQICTSLYKLASRFATALQQSY